MNQRLLELVNMYVNFEIDLECLMTLAEPGEVEAIFM
jgi:hypothetical protein